MSADADEAVEIEVIEVACRAGRLIGLQHGDTQEFRGIRYASAQRFDPPTDITAWRGTYDAMAFGAQAPQVGGALEKMLGSGSLPMDEDCMFLNIATPACDDALRPVLFWVHGGAYVTGSGSMPWYDGNALAQRGDVVVVTINYRLGPLGFLGDRNLGSLDMISALRWVQRNIADFGGDPGDVTTFGESAGGSAVASLMAAPDADDLFHRVWAMSPSLTQIRTPEDALEFEQSFLRAADEHLDSHVESVDDLRTTSLDDILAAQAKMPLSHASFKNFAPTEGTSVIPGSFLGVAAVDSRPLVIGTNRDEMLLFTAFDPTRSSWDDSDVEREFARRFGERSEEAVVAYRAARPGTTASQLVSAMQTDETFRAPSQQLAGSRADAGSPTWSYEFHQTSTAFGGVLGSCHGLDIPFAFHNLTRQGAEMFTGGGDELFGIADRFSDAILAFARTGEPGWPAYDTTDRTTRIIQSDPGEINDPEPEIRALWS